MPLGEKEKTNWHRAREENGAGLGMKGDKARERRTKAKPPHPSHPCSPVPADAISASKGLGVMGVDPPSPKHRAAAYSATLNVALYGVYLSSRGARWRRACTLLILSPDFSQHQARG